MIKLEHDPRYNAGYTIASQFIAMILMALILIGIIGIVDFGWWMTLPLIIWVISYNIANMIYVAKNPEGY